MIQDNLSLFLGLVRLGIGHPSSVIIDSIDWEDLQALAIRQGLSAIVLDGLDQLSPSAYNMNPKFKKCWIGQVIQNYEHKYNLYSHTIANLAGFYRTHGFKMMVLKGYACSLDWPKPEHRPSGDIDIWQFGKQKEADAELRKATSIIIETKRHHHTSFYWGEFLVENHYDFINIHNHRSNISFEIILKELAKDDSYSVDLYGELVYIPSPNLHALFLLKHMMSHFAAEGITLRQVLDWGFFVNAHKKEIDWKWLLDVIDRYGMTPAFDIFNAICVEDLGFDVSIFPIICYNPSMKERVLIEILAPEYYGKLPKGVFQRVAYKYKRWRANAWKHELCYNESLWSSFWAGVWSHLIKPSTI